MLHSMPDDLSALAARTYGRESLYRRLAMAGATAFVLATGGIVAFAAWVPDAAHPQAAGEGSELIAAPLVAPLDGKTIRTPGQSAGGPRARMKCSECGVVESTLEIALLGDDDRFDPATARASGPAAGESLARSEARVPAPAVRKGYQVTVRMNDGASRAFVDARPGNWRRGERVIVLQDVENAGH